MMKTVGFVLLWLVGSSTAIAVAWTGVEVVDDGLVDPAPANSADSTLGNEPFDEAAADEASSAASSAPDVAVEVADSTTTTDSTTTVRPTTSPTDPATTATTATTATSTTDRPTTDRPTTTATSTTAPSTTAPASTTTTSTSTTQAAQTVTFNLVGGATAISFAPGGVTVLWATPNPGFEVKVEPESPGIKVEFRADHHRSRIDAWWSGGPQHEIREEPDD